MKAEIGHNSNALKDIATRARLALEQVDAGEKQTMEGWLQYGAALNEGREMFPGDKEFGEWVAESQLDCAHQKEREAAMWAAANLEEFEAIKEANPRVRTVRGLHAKWKANSVDARVQEWMAPHYAADEAVGKILAWWMGEKERRHDPMVRSWMKRQGTQSDNYHYGGLALTTFSLLGMDQEQALKNGNVAQYETLERGREICCEAMMLSNTKAKVLEALFFNDEANNAGLKAGGHCRQHPLWEAYLTLFNGSGAAECWCCEAMFEQALRDDEEGAYFDELLALKADRKPFWVLSTTAAMTLAA